MKLSDPMVGWVASLSGALLREIHDIQEGRKTGMIDAVVTRAIESMEAMPPTPMFLTCPKCNARHIDEGEFATKPHHTHSCQACGLTWRPAVVTTVGVAFLPGFKNDDGHRVDR